MNAITAQEMRDDYLRRLDTAISDIPHGLAVELRAGIAEELSSADPAVLEARIHELGTPEEVAQAAIEAGFGGPSQAAAPPPTLAPASAEPQPLAPAPAAAPLPLTETRGYAITSAIILGIGGIVIPFVGWIVGAILVTNSKLWSAGEKLWAIVFPPATIILAVLAGWALRAATAQPHVIHGNAPGLEDSAGMGMNPLMPAPYDLLWSAVLVAVVLAPFTAVWLVLRLRGRKTPQK